MYGYDYDHEWQCNDDNFQTVIAYIGRMIGTERFRKALQTDWDRTLVTAEQISESQAAYEAAKADGPDELGRWIKSNFNRSAYDKLRGALRAAAHKKKNPMRNLRVTEPHHADFSALAKRNGLDQKKQFGQLLALGQLMADHAAENGISLFEAVAALGLDADSFKAELDVKGYFKPVWGDDPPLPRNPPLPMPSAFKDEWRTHPQRHYLMDLANKGYIEKFYRKGDQNALARLIKRAWRTMPSGAAVCVFVLKDAPEHIKWVETSLSGGKFLIKAPWYWRFDADIEDMGGGQTDGGCKNIGSWWVPAQKAGAARKMLMERYGEDGTAEVERVSLRINCTHYSEGDGQSSTGVLHVANRLVVSRTSKDCSVDIGNGCERISGSFVPTAGNWRHARIGRNNAVVVMRDVPLSAAKKAANRFDVNVLEVESNQSDERQPAVFIEHLTSFSKVSHWSFQNVEEIEPQPVEVEEIHEPQETKPAALKAFSQ